MNFDGLHALQHRFQRLNGGFVREVWPRFVLVGRARAVCVLSVRALRSLRGCAARPVRAPRAGARAGERAEVARRAGGARRVFAFVLSLGADASPLSTLKSGLASSGAVSP
jgi:hypothetical protein